MSVKLKKELNMWTIRMRVTLMFIVTFSVACAQGIDHVIKPLHQENDTIEGTSSLSTSMNIASQFYVDPVHGADTNSGSTPDKAFKTIERARDSIRNIRLENKPEEHFIISLRDGRYELNETLYFDYRDANLTLKAYKNEEPIICGGRKVTDWKPVEGKPYFVASVPERKAVKTVNPVQHNRILALHPEFYDQQTLSDDGFAGYFAQLYVNGVRAERARTNTIRTSSRETWWDDAETTAFRDGIYMKSADVKAYTNPEDVRLLWLELFKTMDTPLESIMPYGDDEVILKMKQPAFLKGTAWQRINPEVEFFIINALEELDEPGEWYLDQKKDVVYYYPRVIDGDLNKAEVYAPRVEGLVSVDGTPMRRVQNIKFDGITFQNGNWTDPKDNYLGLSQAEIYKTYTSEFPGQIVVNYADNFEITNCVVRNMGSSGIQVYEGCNNTLIEGNVTYDTTGAGITLGRWWFHLAECPSETICTNTMIRNNVVRNTGRDYWQGTGINIFVAYDCKVYHNDISDTAYTALHARAGGSDAYIHPKIGNLEYKYNKVSRAFAGHKWGIGDGGHIYQHGRYPGSVIRENYSLYSNQSVNMEYYPDNDSYEVLWTKNVSRFSKANFSFYQKATATVTGNYSDNKVTKGVTKNTFVENDEWPEEAQNIMSKAGLQPEYKYLLGTIYGHENLAAGKTCKSSSDINRTSDAEAAVDGDWKSFWRAMDSAKGVSWWSVDLGDEYVIQRLTILPRQDSNETQARKMLEIQGSNDPDFKNFAVLAERNEIPWYHKTTSHATNMWEQFINTPKSYRYLRVKSTDSESKLSMAEFSAYGYAK